MTNIPTDLLRTLVAVVDLRADRRLSDAKRLRRFGEAAQVNNRDKCAQQIGWNIRHQRPSTCCGQTRLHTNASEKRSIFVHTETAMSVTR